MFADDGAVTDSRVAAYVGEVSHIDVLAELGAPEILGAKASVALFRLLLVADVLEKLGDGRVGVFYAHQRGFDGLLGLEVPVHDEDGGLGGVHILLVLGIGEEGQGSGLAVFNLGKFGSLGVLVTFDGAFQQLC